MNFRTLIFWLHLAVALVAGSVVIIMSATGVMLTYERQIKWWADTRGFEIEVPASGQRLDAVELARVAGAAEGAEASSVAWRSDAEAPATVSFGRGHSVYVDPYTGAVLGTGSERVSELFSDLRSWHRWLAMTDESRATGRAITGASNLGFLFLVVSGFFLWWPRNWNLPALRNVLLFRRGLSPKARDFNWHNVIGFWSALPLAIVVASGSVISYPWASDLVYRVVGEEPPVRGGGREGASEEQAATPLPAVPGISELSLERIAETQVPEWRTITRTLDPDLADRVAFSIDAGSGGQPQYRSSLTLSATDGSIAAWEPFSAQTPGRRLRSILRFAHTGEVAGIPGQTLAGLVSFGALVLAWTGFWLTLRRFGAWRGRRRRPERLSTPPARRERETAGAGT